ncbi:phosphatidylserine decarboxylase family protein [Candidatus Formimonas warabiya]|uniref:Phosphatidylserine decarboxylase proenzyme n=1 Tax=Formimonas warabiya TaxID=1761012 RepID=A0A3G1KPH4_FORW1|nr:phosphatidylserine decarboxylase family protein [Candidatus Formimonas warabiya]ATW24347.1 phosphatidylserine decarboxylase [Candidatus Formimonas warabiya]
MNNLPVAKESFPFLLVSGFLALLLYKFSPWLGLVPGIIFIFSLYFFRNPPRKINSQECLALSPADGVVMSVDKVWEPEFLGEEVWRVSIFLNIFNVHFNRTPVTGTVEKIKYVPGKFLPAFKSHASDINERNYLVINTGKTKVMVCQITGFIARRIVCWAKMGDTLCQGERFGIIKFGSCTEVYLPLSCSVSVQKGSKVKGGLTVIGRWY